MTARIVIFNSAFESTAESTNCTWRVRGACFFACR